MSYCFFCVCMFAYSDVQHILLSNVFTLWVPCCDISYDFRLGTIFGSSLPPVVCRMDHFLFTLFLFVCIWWCPTHIGLCYLLCLSSSCTQCLPVLWIVQTYLTQHNLPLFCYWYQTSIIWKNKTKKDPSGLLTYILIITHT
jgi:hypothetical protein